MTYYFRSVAEDTAPLRVSILLAGGSGSGKTRTACLLARGLTEGRPWGFIDTEGDRGRHHARLFPEMMRLELGPLDDKGEMVGYPPERLIEVIDAAEASGLEAVVIDSFSHFWEGVNGVLEQQVFALDELVAEKERKADGRYAVNRDNFSQLAWAMVKPRARRMTTRIIQAKCHVILCARAKPMMLDPKSKKPTRANKIRRQDIPWDVAMDKDMVFEMTASFVLNPDTPGAAFWPPVKLADEFKHIFRDRHPIDARAGEDMRRWSVGDAENHKELFDAVRAIARKGKAAFTGYWQSPEGRENRLNLAPIMPELRKIAEDADAADVTQSDDPFGQGDAPAEILEGESYDAPDLPDELAGVFDRICDDLNAAETPLAVAKIIDTFATEIDAIRIASPAHGAEIDGAAEKARAA